jgi:hypothetical protein
MCRAGGGAAERRRCEEAMRPFLQEMGAEHLRVALECDKKPSDAGTGIVNGRKIGATRCAGSPRTTTSRSCSSCVPMSWAVGSLKGRQGRRRVCVRTSITSRRG